MPWGGGGSAGVAMHPPHPKSIGECPLPPLQHLPHKTTSGEEEEDRGRCGAIKRCSHTTCAGVTKDVRFAKSSLRDY